MLLTCFLVCVGGIFVDFGFLCGFFFQSQQTEIKLAEYSRYLDKMKETQRELRRACSSRFRGQFYLIPDFFFPLKLYLEEQPLVILVFLESRRHLQLRYTQAISERKLLYIHLIFSRYAEFVRLSVHLKCSVTILKYYYLSNRMKISRSSSSVVSYLIHKISLVVPEHLS